MPKKARQDNQSEPTPNADDIIENPPGSPSEVATSNVHDTLDDEIDNTLDDESHTEINDNLDDIAEELQDGLESGEIENTPEEIRTWLQDNLINPTRETLDNLTSQIAEIQERATETNRMITEIRANQSPPLMQQNSPVEPEILESDTNETIVEQLSETRTVAPDRD